MIDVPWHVWVVGWAVGMLASVLWQRFLRGRK